LVDPDKPEDLANALRRVLTDESLGAEMSKMGLARAARFGWKRVAQETLAVYQQVLGE
jgi:glycosyltransferase involved in cell wall biosynthesis